MAPVHETLHVSGKAWDCPSYQVRSDYRHGCQMRPSAAEKFGLTRRKRPAKLVNRSWHPGLQDTRGLVHVWDIGL